MSLDGLLVLHKPAGLTSRAVVDRVERWFPGTRAGHAGTLDPLATGVLVVCLGAATRLVEYVQRFPKTYLAELRLGARSDTDDADGVIEPVTHAPVPTLDQVSHCLSTFLGEIDQVPPSHSAVHVEGRRAYDLARRGREVQLAAKRVHIDRIELVRYDFPQLEIVVDCGKGTYVRSLARDIGEKLGCGALITRLCRTRIGPFRLDDALPFEVDPETAARRLLPLETALSGLPSVSLSADQTRRLNQGQKLALSQSEALALPSQFGEVAILDPEGQLVAVGHWQPETLILAPRKVF